MNESTVVEALDGGELFVGTMRDEIRKRPFREPAERARIVRASLRGDAELAGVTYLAFRTAGAQEVIEPSSFNT
jgi:hypothetical protein